MHNVVHYTLLWYATSSELFKKIAWVGPEKCFQCVSNVALCLMCENVTCTLPIFYKLINILKERKKKKTSLWFFKGDQPAFFFGECGYILQVNQKKRREKKCKVVRLIYIFSRNALLSLKTKLLIKYFFLCVVVWFGWWRNGTSLLFV